MFCWKRNNINTGATGVCFGAFISLTTCIKNKNNVGVQAYHFWFSSEFEGSGFVCRIVKSA